MKGDCKSWGVLGCEGKGEKCRLRYRDGVTNWGLEKGEFNCGSGGGYTLPDFGEFGGGGGGGGCAPEDLGVVGGGGGGGIAMFSEAP